MSTSTNHALRLSRVVLPAAVAGVLTLAACGSSGGSGSHGSTAAGGGNAAVTVQVRTVAGHSGVLVSGSGRTLYVSDQENGMVLCKTSACTAVWVPLTVPSGSTPTGPSQVAGKLSTMAGAGGKSQVAFDGRPLYTFAFDHGAGQLGGNGAHDSFGGTSFSWHAATVSGPMAGAPATSSAPSTSGGGGGGYGGY